MTRPIDETSVLEVLETLSPYVNNWVMEQVVSAIRALPDFESDPVPCDTCQEFDCYGCEYSEQRRRRWE